MEVQIAALADCANVAPPDKLNIMGVFDTIFTPNFPCAIPFMALALRLKLDHEDAGRPHELTVSLHDENSNEVARATGVLGIEEVPVGEVRHVNQILSFANLGFTRPGRFSFRIAWDGRPKAEIDLSVRHVQPEATR